MGKFNQHPKFYIFIAFIAAFAGILFGYDTGVISGAILFIDQQFQLSAAMNGVVVSSVLLGAFGGAILSGRLADHWGRKHMLIIDAIIFIIGTVLAAIANSILLLIIGRFIVGVAIGVSSYIAPLYIAEISPPHKRGFLVSLNQLAVTIGILISYIVDYIFSHTGNWRWMFLSGVVPAVLLLIGVLGLPYSPRWLIFKGYPERALAILRRIRHPHIATQELAEIQASLLEQHGNYKQLFSKIVRKTVIIAAGLALLQQVTGVNTILYYAPTIFKMSGFSDASASILATMGIGLIFVLFTLIALPLIDKWGRRPLLFIGLIAMAFGLIALSYTFWLDQVTIFTRWLAISSMVIFIIGFAISMGPIMWLMIAEVFPLKLRGLGTSFATCVNWASNWLVTISFLSLVQYLSLSGTFLIYFIICLVTLVFVYFLVPETKDTSLEQIEANLYAGKASRHLGDPIE